jgi:hypothetical protein
VRYLLHKIPYLARSLRQHIPFHSLTFLDDLNDILPSTLRSPKWYFPSGYSTDIPYTLPNSYACYIPLRSLYRYIDPPSNS